MKVMEANAVMVNKLGRILLILNVNDLLGWLTYSDELFVDDTKIHNTAEKPHDNSKQQTGF